MRERKIIVTRAGRLVWQLNYTSQQRPHSPSKTHLGIKTKKRGCQTWQGKAVTCATELVPCCCLRPVMQISSLLRLPTGVQHQPSMGSPASWAHAPASLTFAWLRLHTSTLFAAAVNRWPHRKLASLEVVRTAMLLNHKTTAQQKQVCRLALACKHGPCLL